MLLFFHSCFSRRSSFVPRESITARETHRHENIDRGLQRERERFTHTQIFTHIETDGEQENGVTGKARTTGEDWSEKKHIIIRRAEFFTSSSVIAAVCWEFHFHDCFFLAMAQSNWEADKM